MPVLSKVSQVMFFRRHNSAGKTAAARAKLASYLQIGVRQMDPRRAAMQGEKHKAARNLSRAGAARVHTRRLARASRLMGWIDL